MGLNRFLKERASIWRQTEQPPDVYGQPTGQWQSIYEGVPCYYQQTVTEEEHGRQNRISSNHRVWFNIGVDLSFGDRIEIKGRHGVWQVLTIDPDRALRKHHMEVVIEEVRV